MRQRTHTDHPWSSESVLMCFLAKRELFPCNGVRPELGVGGGRRTESSVELKRSRVGISPLVMQDTVVQDKGM